MLTELQKKLYNELLEESKTWNIRRNLNDIGEGAVSTRVLVNGQWIDKEFRRNQFWDEKKGIYNLSTRTKSFRVFSGEGRNIDDVIEGDADFRRMFRLMKYMNDCNQLMYSDNKKKAVPMNKKIMAIVFKMTEKKVGEFLSRMKKLNIIKEDGMGNYFINPLYTMASRGITVKVFLLFRKELEAVLNENAIKDLQTLAYYDLHPEELALEMERNKKTLEELLIDGRQYDAIDEMDSNLEPRVVSDKELKEREEQELKLQISNEIMNHITMSSKTKDIASQVIVKEEGLVELFKTKYKNRIEYMATSSIVDAMIAAKSYEKLTLAELVNNCEFLQGIDLETGEILDFIKEEPKNITVNVNGREIIIPKTRPTLKTVKPATTKTAPIINSYGFEEEEPINIPEQFKNM